jgi:hypothetical protein
MKKPIDVCCATPGDFWSFYVFYNVRRALDEIEWFYDYKPLILKSENSSKITLATPDTDGKIPT